LNFSKNIPLDARGGTNELIHFQIVLIRRSRWGTGLIVLRSTD